MAVRGMGARRRRRRSDERNVRLELGHVGGMDGVGGSWDQRLLFPHQPLHLIVCSSKEHELGQS